MKRSSLLAAALFLTPMFASAHEGNLRIQLILVQASKNGTSVDPKLNGVMKDLKADPQWTNLQMVPGYPVNLTLGRKGETSHPLPNGKQVKLTSLGDEHGNKKEVKMRFEVPGVIPAKEYDAMGRADFVEDLGPLGGAPAAAAPAPGAPPPAAPPPGAPPAAGAPAGGASTYLLIVHHSF